VFRNYPKFVNMWAGMGPYTTLRWFQKTQRNPMGPLSSPKYFLREMKCPFKHLFDSQDYTRVQGKSILKGQN
jgi:hypothetical protein